MARMRMIKPGFFTNDTLAELEPLARLLFIGLWCIADREGRLDDRPKRIKVEVMPYDDVNVNDLLQALHDSGFILRYAHGEYRYIQVLNFAKHQSPHIKEQASTIPAPYSHSASTGHESGQHVTSPSYTDTDTDTDTENHVAADADDVTNASPSAAPTRSEQKNAKGKKRAASTTSPAGGASFAQDSTPYQLAAHLRDAILAHKPDANVPRDDKRLQGWAVITDRMVRLDKRDPVKIRALMDWATQDDFWSANILSPGSFRDHYDQLELQRTRKAQTASNNGTGGNGGNGAGSTSSNGRNKPHGAQTIDEYSRVMNAELERLGYGK